MCRMRVTCTDTVIQASVGMAALYTRPFNSFSPLFMIVVHGEVSNTLPNVFLSTEPGREVWEYVLYQEPVVACSQNNGF